MKKRVEQTVKSLKFYLKAKEIGTRDMSGKSSDKLFVNRVISGGSGLGKSRNHEFKIFKTVKHDSFLGTFNFKTRPHHKLSCPILCQFIFCQMTESANEKPEFMDLIKILRSESRGESKTVNFRILYQVGYFRRFIFKMACRFH